MKSCIKQTMIMVVVLIMGGASIHAQTINSDYVKKLYRKYPTKKSAFCDACKLWVNPYFKSVADTEKHMPLVTYYVYTKEHRLMQEQDTTLSRNKVLAKWNSVYGQPDESGLYREARDQNKGLKPAELLVKGHCEAWILLAYTPDGAIFSNTYTFNAGLEFQGQNVGTEIATEERCRQLTGFKKEAITDSVKIWCGTFGSQKTYTYKGITATVPSHYYKIMTYRNNKTHKNVTECYWMPNEPTEVKSKLQERMVTHDELVKDLGYDPMKVISK